MLRAWGKKAVRSCGVLRAVVRSLDFIEKAVGETRGFKVGYERFSSCVGDDGSCWAEDLQRQTWPAGRQCLSPTRRLVCTGSGPERRASGRSQPQTHDAVSCCQCETF